jgi:glycosyltransferase involved in cell wall biosynthesis
VDLEYFSPSDELREPETLVYTGKMSYHANISAVLFLVEEVMPLIWAQRPQVKIQIVGKDPPRAVRFLENGNRNRIRVTGTVSDIRPYLRSATLAVAPVPYGAGIQNKVLEAMACGTPLVVTNQAVSALNNIIPGEHLLTGESPQAFADEALKLLEDSGLREDISVAARAYVERYHNWELIVHQLQGIYREVISEHRN